MARLGIQRGGIQKRGAKANINGLWKHDKFEDMDEEMDEAPVRRGRGKGRFAIGTF